MLKAVLQFALERKRPTGGRGEEDLATFIEVLFEGKTERDAIGNIHLDLRGATGSRTLFVGHLDTVHREDGPNKIWKLGDKWYAWDSQLGADDGAGVAMLAHLAHHGVPGYYLFTRGEERGGIGSSWLAQERPALLQEFDRAIAFDRKGYDSVITHQAYGRCCSDDFGQALSEALTTETMWYLPDSTGIYTDTAEFVDYIPECTNISVGYHDEHTHEERLDLAHLRELARVALKLDWESLPVKRDPNEIEDWRSSFSIDKPAVGMEEFEPSLRWLMYDALDDAEIGNFERLAELIASEYYKGDEEAARAAMRDLHLTTEMIDETWNRMENENPYDVLDWLAQELALV